MGLVRLEPREQSRKVWLLLFDVECNLLPDVLTFVSAASAAKIVLATWWLSASAVSAAIFVLCTCWPSYVLSMKVFSGVLLLLTSIASRILAAQVSWAIVSAALVFIAIVSAARFFIAIVPAARVAKAIVPATRVAKAMVSAGLWTTRWSRRTTNLDSGRFFVAVINVFHRINLDSLS